MAYEHGYKNPTGGQLELLRLSAYECVHVRTTPGSCTRQESCQLMPDTTLSISFGQLALAARANGLSWQPATIRGFLVLLSVCYRGASGGCLPVPYVRSSKKGPKRAKNKDREREQQAGYTCNKVVLCIHILIDGPNSKTRAAGP